MKRLAAMTPAEQETYKKEMLKAAENKLKDVSQAANITIDETLLPTSELVLPTKDIARLSLITMNPPTRQQMIAETSKMEAALKSAVGPQLVQQVEQFSANKSFAEIQAASVGGWYGNNPQAALLLGMKAVKQEPSNVLGWNNFASQLSLSGQQHQAIPILKNLLEEKPNNSMILNNMGQAYLGLGDLDKAKQYLESCLNIDDLHPEANHSMGLIHLHGNDAEKALKYFEKELQVAQRRSTLAQLVKSGNRDKINLAALRKQKMQMDGTPSRDFFEEINLGKFKLPDAPENSKASERWRLDNKDLMEGIGQETIYWQSLGFGTEEEYAAEGKKHFGLYHDLVNELIRDLGNQYIPLLQILSEDDVSYLIQLEYDYAKKDRERKCPEPPFSPGNTAAVFEAYEKQCCDLKTPLIDKFMSDYNSYVSSRIKKAVSNYKQYINGLINAVQLDPSMANKRMVYATVGNYFAFLGNAMGSYKVLDEHQSCKSKLTAQEAQDIIESARAIEFQCPSWLKVNASLLVAKLKADCNGFNIEADIYKMIHVGVEKKFKTGTSTLYVGGGIEGKFRNMAKGSIKQQFYITFDHNNEFSDLGMRGNATGELAGGAIGADFSYDFAMNAGFNAQGKVKSDWITKYEKALNYVK